MKRNVKLRSRDSRELGVGRRRVRFAGSKPRLAVGPRGVERLGREWKKQRLQSTPAAAGANSTGPMGEQSLRTIGSRTEFEV